MILSKVGVLIFVHFMSRSKYPPPSSNNKLVVICPKKKKKKKATVQR